MALVTDTFGMQFPFELNIWNPITIRRSKGLLNAAAFICVGVLAGGGMLSATGFLESALPVFVTVAAPVIRRLPNAIPQQLAVVNHKVGLDHIVRQRFIEAYTADTLYSNMDWHRNKLNDDTDIIADIGADGIIEEKPASLAIITEPRAERVPFTPSQSIVQPAPAIMQPSPDTTIQHASIKAAHDTRLPDDVPLPLRRPVVSQDTPEVVYVPESKRTQEPKHEGLLRRLFKAPVSSRAAIYDISAATVYLPNGERLEAHSGIGAMRDNPTSVTQKNRGATPPHTYNLKMRESLFHGVAAIRLTPVDGRNPHNRDGLLAHTYMLGRAGNSNGCVVFKDYARFLNAFKRGEFNQLIVVTSMASKSSRVASIF